MKNNELKNLILNKNLSQQKTDCLHLLANGFSAKEIGEKLKLSKHTVESYLADIRRLYGCRNSRELIAIYYKNGMKNLTFV
ncbi:MAG: helix-turn-helix transcriptional regulator [Coxiellaceae bacterium]|nr:helix-turn-helix transcriptional regulator [Coxiellaceae bacterium]